MTVWIDIRMWIWDILVVIKHIDDTNTKQKLQVKIRLDFTKMKSDSMISFSSLMQGWNQPVVCFLKLGCIQNLPCIPYFSSGIVIEQ